MKIDTHNSLGHRFSSISDINRLIAIDYYRLQSSLAIIEFHRFGHVGKIDTILVQGRAVRAWD